MCSIKTAIGKSIAVFLFEQPSSTAKSAPEVTAYAAAGDSAVNHYDVRHNLIAKVVWMAKDDTKGGGGGFYRAFVRMNNEGYTGTHASPAATPLKRIATGTVSHDVTTDTHSDDDYELLAKGLGAYNQGAGTFLNIISTKPWTVGPPTAWIDMLVNGVAGTKKVAVEYALAVMHDANKMDLPYRTYIWAGELEPDEIEQLDASGNPVTDSNGDPVMMPNPDAGEPVWCFAYGEEEWLAGKTWSEVLKDATGDVITAPIGRVGCN